MQFRLEAGQRALLPDGTLVFVVRTSGSYPRFRHAFDHRNRSKDIEFYRYWVVAADGDHPGSGPMQLAEDLTPVWPSTTLATEQIAELEQTILPAHERFNVVPKKKRRRAA